MINYYKLLGIDRKLNEEKLMKLLNRRIDYLTRKKGKANGEDKIYTVISEALYRRFLMTIKHYGSKENYDKALGKSYDKIVKVKKPSKESLKKFVLIGTISGVIIGGITAANLFDVVEVPLYDNEDIKTISQELEEIGIPNNFLYTSGMADRIAKYVVPENKTEEVNEFNEERSKGYIFKYVLKTGDTSSGLMQKFEATGIGGSCDFAGDEVTIYTRNKQIALEWQRKYDEEKERKKQEYIASITPDHFEQYVVKPGDTVAEIANAFGITASELMRFNNNKIPDIYTVYAGDTLRIPVFEKEKTK